MNEQAFVEKREADWRALGLLVEKASVSPTQLTSKELMDYVRLYRLASRDLATVRTRSSNDELAEHLNMLVGRAYALLYRPAPKPLRQAVPNTLRLVAGTVRRMKWFCLASFLLFASGFLLNFALLETNPGLRNVLIGPDQEQLFESWKSGEKVDPTFDQSLMMAGLYSSNNPFVAIVTASASVATFGVLSVSILFSNGQLLGSLASELESVGRLPSMLTILPHGVTEVSGLLLAGAAGLRLGWALWAPGRRRRGESLRVAGKEAIIALGAAVVMMLIAAPFEAFFSFNPNVSLVYKVTLASVLAIAWGFFWVGYGRDSEQQDDEGKRREVVHGV